MDVALDLRVDVVVSRLAGRAGGAIDIFPLVNLAIDAEAVAEVPGLAESRLVVADPSVPKALDEVVLPPGLVRADLADEPVPGCGRLDLAVLVFVVGRVVVVVVGRAREGVREDFAGMVCELGRKLAGRDMEGATVVRDVVDPIRDFCGTPVVLAVLAATVAVEPVLDWGGRGTTDLAG